MGNMSYARFRNTLDDLLDCHDYMMEFGLADLSNEERMAAIELIKLCVEIVDCAQDDSDIYKEIYGDDEEDFD